MPTHTDVEPTTPATPQAQGDLSTLDDVTDQEAIALRNQMNGAQDFQGKGPIIWGSIRVFSVYGKWSFWRSPKRR